MECSITANGLRLGEGCLTDAQSSQNVYGSFCQAADMVQLIEYCGGFLNLKTIPQYAAMWI